MVRILFFVLVQVLFIFILQLKAGMVQVLVKVFIQVLLNKHNHGASNGGPETAHVRNRRLF